MGSASNMQNNNITIRKLWNDFETTSKQYRDKIPARQFDYSTNISLKYEYLYLETPKVACSTIKSCLQKMELGDINFHREDFEAIHKREFSPLLKASQIGNLDNLISKSEIFKFCFVRNPYTRILSAYLDKIVKCKPAKANILKAMGHDSSNLNTSVNFKEFITTIYSQNIAEMDPHWRIQYFQTCQKSIPFDYIGRLETFNKDFNQILSILNNANPCLYFTSEQRHSTNSNKLLSKYYTPSLQAMIREKFSADFNYFNYSHTLPTSL